MAAAVARGSRHPDLFYWKTTIFSPEVLRLNSVPVFRVEHTPGTYVVTLPRAYHCGFNVGFNVSESVNFALPDWLPVGVASLERYRTAPRRDSTLLHEALVVTAALASAEAADSIAAGRRPADAAAACARTRVALAAELRRLLAQEAKERGALLGSAIRGSSAVEQVALDVLANARAEAWEDGLSSRAELWKCRECRHYGYMSVVRCSCSATRRRHYLCLRHALSRDPPAPPPPPPSKRAKGAASAPVGLPPPPPCKCKPCERELIVRYTPAALRALLARLDPAAAEAEREGWPPAVPAGALERAAAGGSAEGRPVPAVRLLPAAAASRPAGVAPAVAATAASAANGGVPLASRPPAATGAAASCTLRLEPAAAEPKPAVAAAGLSLPIQVESR